MEKSILIHRQLYSLTSSTWKSIQFLNHIHNVADGSSTWISSKKGNFWVDSIVNHWKKPFFQHWPILAISHQILVTHVNAMWNLEFQDLDRSSQRSHRLPQSQSQSTTGPSNAMTTLNIHCTWMLEHNHVSLRHSGKKKSDSLHDIHQTQIIVHTIR